MQRYPERSASEQEQSVQPNRSAVRPSSHSVGTAIEGFGDASDAVGHATTIHADKPIGDRRPIEGSAPRLGRSTSAISTLGDSSGPSGLEAGGPPSTTPRQGL